MKHAQKINAKVFTKTYEITPEYTTVGDVSN